MKLLLTAVFSFFTTGLLLAQQYTVNGDAIQNNCHCYTLTPDLSAQSGSVWNNYKIDLSNSFTFVFSVSLGCTDVNGADGIAFVLQPISTSIGGTGSGLGFGGISPSIGVTLDTYQNSSPDNDPFYDHIAIQRNGILDHLSTDNLAGPIQASATSDDIEDCADHQLKISWDATTKTLSAFFDGVLRVSVLNDLVTTTFAGDPLVYWGFTGSTGALFNLQKFCTALTPQWNFTATQKRCVNEPITFNDATVSFAPLAKIYWDFGDGSNIDSVHLSPTHTYTAAGIYTVSQKVRGIDGCEETNTQQVLIGSKPNPGFYIADSCEDASVRFFDTSHVIYGTINSYYWNLDDGMPITQNSAAPITVYPTYGIKTIHLAVTSQEGCASDTLVKTIFIHAMSVADFSSPDTACMGWVHFTDQSTWVEGNLDDGSWFVDGDPIDVSQNFAYEFTTPGNHTVMLMSHGGTDPVCGNGVISKNIFIRDKPIAYFKHDGICQSYATTFTDSSYASINQWWWDLGNGNISTSQNPTTIYNTPGADTILFVATTINGCPTDTLRQPVFVNAKPIANFGIDALKCFGTPIQFSDSSHVDNGTINAWTWLYSTNIWSSVQNPSGLFVAGQNGIALGVTSNVGCRSDTVFKVFYVFPKSIISMNFKDECKYTPVNFTGSVLVGNIDQWHWSFGDGATGNTMSPTHTYTANGTYSVSLFAIDFLGCSTDVLKKDIIIYGTNAFAGNDTIAAAGQPIQLNAIGGLSYTWSPSTGLSNTNIANPIAILSATQTYTLKAFTPEGCESYDDIKIEIYKGPDIYLPTAFTPNNDGLNDVFRGKPVGIKEFRYLKVYNRWGQEVFSTTDYRIGWDGSWKGAAQGNGVFVVMASGIDFRGKLINKKSTVMLIR